ncbi:MAG: MinD/ParA family protein [Gemmatimonadota bacterium]
MSRPTDSLKSFLATNERTNPFRPRRGVLVVGSGKGGTGTSVVSSLLAQSAAIQGERVLLVDADESVGSLHYMFGLRDPGPGLGALRGGRVTPEQLVRSVTPSLFLLPGGGGGADATLSSATAERRAMFQRVSDLYEQFGIVIVDGGSRLESVMAACGAGVERLLCVTGPGRISLAASYALFKVARSRFEELPVELLVNTATDRAGQTLHAVVRQATQSFLATDVHFGGAIPEDEELHRLIEAGEPLTRLAPNSAAVAAAGAIMGRLLAEQELLHLPDPSVLTLQPPS